MDHEFAGTRADAVAVCQLLLNSDLVVFAHRLLVYGATGGDAGMQALPFNDVAAVQFQDSEMCLCVADTRAPVALCRCGPCARSLVATRLATPQVPVRGRNLAAACAGRGAQCVIQPW